MALLFLRCLAAKSATRPCWSLHAPPRLLVLSRMRSPLAWLQPIAYRTPVLAPPSSIYSKSCYMRLSRISASGNRQRYTPDYWNPSFTNGRKRIQYYQTRDHQPHETGREILSTTARYWYPQRRLQSQWPKIILRILQKLKNISQCP